MTQLNIETEKALVCILFIYLTCLPFMDLSGYFSLSELIDRLRNERIKPIVVVRPGVGIRQQMMEMGYGDLLGADGMQTDYNDALLLAWEYLDSSSEN